MHPSEAHVLSSVVEPNLSSVKFLLWQSVHVLLHCVLGILSNIIHHSLYMMKLSFTTLASSEKLCRIYLHNAKVANKNFSKKAI